MRHRAATGAGAEAVATSAAPLRRVEQLAETIAATRIDRSAIPQASLDLTERARTSLFPWRGQFSPQLVDLLLDFHARPGAVIVDPFVGSGTTLFESCQRGMKCYGSEINRAAFHFASLARAGTLSPAQRRAERSAAERVFGACFAPLLPPDLFRPPAAVRTMPSPEQALRSALGALDPTGVAHHILATAVLLAMGDGSELIAGEVEQCLGRVWRAIEDRPQSTESCTVLLRDARRISLDAECADIVITSPPYVNVFNYHQNYRKAVEMMGSDVLRGAASEIGANRKFRQNRILTVVQYALDMTAALAEMRRVLKPSGVAVLVVGRESRVCGLSVRNGQLLAMLAAGGAGFKLALRQERVFTNRFGDRIWEDILTLVPDPSASPGGPEFARSTALWVLRQLAEDAPPEVRAAIDDAVERLPIIEPSPLLDDVPRAA